MFSLQCSHWIRLLLMFFFNCPGYANELAEAFRPVINRYTIYSGYGLAIGYMIADIADKTYKVSKVFILRLNIKD